MSVNVYDPINDTLIPVAGATLYADVGVGFIGAFDAEEVPDGWLIFNGQTKNRADYPDLWARANRNGQVGVGKFYGIGDGSTTFTLADLRGEFLRGAGTNSHSGQGNGGSVGEHQDATEISAPNVGSDYTQLLNLDSSYGFKNSDNNNAQVLESYYDMRGITTYSGGRARVAFVRPTNTSVVWAVKARQTGLPIDLKAEVEKAVVEKVGKVQVKAKSLFSNQTINMSFTLESGRSYTYSAQEYSDTDGYHSYARTVRNMDSSDYDSLGVVKLQWAKLDTTATLSIKNTGAHNVTITVFVTLID